MLTAASDNLRMIGVSRDFGAFIKVRFRLGGWTLRRYSLTPQPPA